MLKRQAARWWGFLIILLLGSVFLSVKVPQRAYALNKPAKIIVKLKDEPKTSSLLSLSSSAPDAVLIGGVPNTNSLIYQTQMDVEETLQSLRSDPHVEAAFPDVAVRLFKATNDDYYDKQWSLVNMKVGEVTGTPENTAWDKLSDINVQTGNIKVAVIDSGIDQLHTDLSSKLTDEDMITCSCVDNDGDDLCDENSCHTGGGMDDFGHGTHVAGIIGADTNNSEGMAGVGWGVKLMSIKVLDDKGEGSMLDMLLGIGYAVDNGVRVINLSLGAPEEVIDYNFIEMINETMDYAYENNVVVVAAAGNCGSHDHYTGDRCDDDDGSHLTNPKMYPAAASHVISVASLKVNNELAEYSEHNKTDDKWVNVAAPGGSCNADNKGNCILSILKSDQCEALWKGNDGFKESGGYCYLQGTSMAAPNAAGVAALILAKNPNLTVDQVRDYIKDTADESLPTDDNDATQWGGIDAMAVLTAVNANATPTGYASPTPLGPTNTPAPPTLTPSPTPYPTTGTARMPRIPPNPYPAPPFCPSTVSCTNKIFGDADCSDVVDFADYGIWFTQFDTFPPGIPNNPNANFSCVEGNSTTYFVDMPDFEVWRRNTTDLGNVTPTRTPTPTDIPEPPTDTPRPPTNTPVPPTPTDAPVPTNPPPPTATPGSGTWYGDCKRGNTSPRQNGDCIGITEINPRPLSDAECEDMTEGARCVYTWQYVGYDAYDCIQPCWKD